MENGGVKNVGDGQAMNINRNRLFGRARFKAEVQPDVRAEGWIMLKRNWKCKTCGVSWEGMEAPLSCLICGAVDGFDEVEEASLQERQTMVIQGIADHLNPDTFICLVSKEFMKLLCDQTGVKVEFKEDEFVLDVAKRNMKQ